MFEFAVPAVYNNSDFVGTATKRERITVTDFIPYCVCIFLSVGRTLNDRFDEEHTHTHVQRTYTLSDGHRRHYRRLRMSRRKFYRYDKISRRVSAGYCTSTLAFVRSPTVIHHLVRAFITTRAKLLGHRLVVVPSFVAAHRQNLDTASAVFIFLCVRVCVCY